MRYLLPPLTIALLSGMPADAQSNEACAPGVGSDVPRCVAPLRGAQTYNPAEAARDRDLSSPREAWLEGTYTQVNRARIDRVGDNFIRYETPDGEYTVTRTLPQVEPKVDQISDLFR